jgi:hypothetical protein
LGASDAAETAVLAGDLTGNGAVDFADLSLLLAHWNDPEATLADGNLVEPADSSVDFRDLTVLLSNWTGPAPSFSGPLVLTPLSPTSVQLNPSSTVTAGSRFFRLFLD